ncbi:MAG: hypothetical protein ACHQK9_08635 [Reyranellales bacterium]
MLSSVEIARGTQGALRFLQRDAAAPLYFDNTFASCLRSFRVMVLVAPIYGIYLLLYYSNVETTADEAEILGVEALRYVVDWLLFPVIFYEIARRRAWLDRYPRYIAALNWINLPAMALAVLGLGVSIVAPHVLAVIVELGLRAVFFYWFLTATRMTLGISWLFSGLLLVVNWVPSLFLSFIVERFLGVTAIVGG